MKKAVIFLVLFSSFLSFAQADAWVYFKDKPNAAAFFSNPLSELSQRSLDRRTSQGISLEIKDAPIHVPYITSVTNASGIIVKAKSKWLNCLHVRGSTNSIEALKALPFVHNIEFADKFFSPSPSRLINKSEVKPINKTSSISTNFNYGNSSNQIQMLNGHLLHQLNYTGSGKIIAVLDSGFPGVDLSAPFKRLRDNNQILGGYDYVNKSTFFYSGNFHGTTVLSTMGGFVDGKLVGTAPDAKYYLYITEDAVSTFPNSENPVEESNWVEGAEEADREGADIICSSLGYFGYDNPNYSHSYSDMTGNKVFASRGANIAFEKGIIVVASAGNEGQQSEPHIGTPAEAKNVIAVGAVQSNKAYANFSSIGPSFDGRVKPDVTAQGQSVVLSDILGNISTANGTSYSCPITAGMVACLWQGLPGKTAQQMKQLIVQSSDNFVEPAPRSRTQFGYGIPDFNKALANGLSVEEFENADFKIYPNPTTDLLSFSIVSKLESARVQIYSILGQKLVEGNISTAAPTISLKSLSNGVYFYKIESSTFCKSGKIIKQ